MAEPDSIRDAKAVDPYLLPAERQGWRGLTVGGQHKRKAWTVLHNEQVLVTALLLIPGERTIRHSHETGELSIHYYGELRPVVSWNPPGHVHPALSAAPASSAGGPAAELAAAAAGNAAIVAILQTLVDEQTRLRERLDELTRSHPAPFVIIDVLFPPFKTTIEDAAAGSKTVVGQWWD